MQVRCARHAGTTVMFGAVPLTFDADGLAEVGDSDAPLIAAAVAQMPRYEIVGSVPQAVVTYIQPEDLTPPPPPTETKDAAGETEEPAGETQAAAGDAADEKPDEEAEVTLTVKEIKDRLFAAGVEYQANARKDDLIELARREKVSLS